ncbi:MAG: AraC family transcriptional regulator [Proteobacteria bacterium]|nr:AraC family transcriptional regulator [Pseudomonadota bacterium]
MDLLPFVCERELVSILRMFEDVTNTPINPTEVHFNYPEPAYGSLYPHFFHCPVYFNAPRLLFIVDQKYLDYSLPKSDPIMKSIYEKECQELVKKYRNQDTVKDIVKHHIKSTKGEFLDLETISSRLNMSSRTLRRKLTAEKTSYQQIIDDIKKDEAISFLANTSISIEEIAAKIGYSNTANFYHAFKKWTGRTPSEYRKRRYCG